MASHPNEFHSTFGFGEPAHDSEDPETPSPASSFDNDEREVCQVCFAENHRFLTALRPCGHIWCIECLEHLLQQAIANDRLPATCCAPIAIDDFDFRLDDELLRTYRSSLAGVRNTPNPTFCHRRECGARIPLRQITNGIGVCSECNSRTCEKCKEAAHSEHSGECPVDEGIEEVLRLARREGWSRCPSCRIVVELRDGCPHITCRCGTEFCYHRGSERHSCHGLCVVSEAPLVPPAPEEMDAAQHAALRTLARELEGARVDVVAAARTITAIRDQEAEEDRARIPGAQAAQTAQAAQASRGRTGEAEARMALHQAAANGGRAQRVGLLAQRGAQLLAQRGAQMLAQRNRPDPNPNPPGTHGNGMCLGAAGGQNNEAQLGAVRNQEHAAYYIGALQGADDWALEAIYNQPGMLPLGAPLNIPRAQEHVAPPVPQFDNHHIAQPTAWPPVQPFMHAMVQPLMYPVAPAQAIFQLDAYAAMRAQQIKANLRDIAQRNGCIHTHAIVQPDEHQCQGCNYRVTDYIVECQHCHVRLCRRCRSGGW